MRRTPYKRPVVTVRGDGKPRQQLVSRVTMEKHLGRPLLSAEIVHHINGNPFDNRIENLKIMTRAEHLREHRPELLEAFREVVPLNLPTEEIVKLFETTSANQIAKRYGCSNTSILRVLRSVLGNVGLRKKPTHCKRGHEFKGDNFAFDKRGDRWCRICSRIRARARKKLKELQKAA